MSHREEPNLQGSAAPDPYPVTTGAGEKGGSAVTSAKGGLPPWLTATVVVSLIVMFGYNLVVYGPDGYPTAIILGGLLGGYTGLNELIRRRGNGDQ